MKKTRCIFCGTNQQKAKEHILPKWLQKELFGSTVLRFTGTRFIQIGGQPNGSLQSVENTSFGRVCRSCCSGWLNDIELSCKNTIKSLINDPLRIGNLNQEERKCLSAWAFKTALIINAGTNFKKIVPHEHYLQLWLARSVPNNVVIDLGKINDRTEFTWRQADFDFNLTNMPGWFNKLYNPIWTQSYRITIQIFNFAMRVSFYPYAEERKIVLKTIDRNKSYRIWPEVLDSEPFANDSFDNIDEMDSGIFMKPIP